MTDKTFTFTIEQIKEIYDAGVRRGNEEYCSHDWGGFPSGSYYDECVEAIHDIINKDKDYWSDPDYINWDTIESWFKEKK